MKSDLRLKLAIFHRQFCEEKGIPYVHFASISENVSSTARHLFDMGHNEKPLKAKIA